MTATVLRETPVFLDLLSSTVNDDDEAKEDEAFNPAQGRIPLQHQPRSGQGLQLQSKRNENPR